MFGAILGDIIGSPYEFDMGNKTKDFPLFSEHSHFTDDSVMTIAVAEALMVTAGQSDEEIKSDIIFCMQRWGRKYPNAGYGGMFSRWLREKDPQPYNSFGNGSAMRVSSVGWFYDTLEETRHMARLTAEVSHNHPEGIKGAEATASAIFLARTGKNKDEIFDYIVNEFGIKPISAVLIYLDPSVLVCTIRRIVNNAFILVSSDLLFLYLDSYVDAKLCI